jgi:hypothetical protein
LLAVSQPSIGKRGWSITNNGSILLPPFRNVPFLPGLFSSNQGRFLLLRRLLHPIHLPHIDKGIRGSRVLVDHHRITPDHRHPIHCSLRCPT